MGWGESAVATLRVGKMLVIRGLGMKLPTFLLHPNPVQIRAWHHLARPT